MHHCRLVSTGMCFNVIRNRPLQTPLAKCCSTLFFSSSAYQVDLSIHACSQDVTALGVIGLRVSVMLIGHVDKARTSVKTWSL